MKDAQIYSMLKNGPSIMVALNTDSLACHYYGFGRVWLL